MVPHGKSSFWCREAVVFGIWEGNGHDVSEWSRQFRGNSDVGTVIWGALDPQGGGM